MHSRLHTGGTGWRVDPLTLLVIAALHLLLACALITETATNSTPPSEEIAAQ